jgi:Na+/melibiose symporter-like transporter
MVNAAARLLVVLPIGVLIDRVNRTTVLWAANLSRGLLMATLALMVANGPGSIAVLYGVFALIGVMESAADNSSLSVLPAVVETEDLDKANSQLSAAQLVADEFAGPPLGGLMFAAAIALPFAVMGALYAAAAVLFLGLRVNVRPERVPGQTGSIGRDLLVGARWLKGNRLLFGLAVIGGLASVAYMMPFSILVLFSKEVLGLDAAGYGVLLSASAVGGLVGSFVAAPLRRRVGYARTVVGSLALGALTLAAVSFTTVPWVAAICLAAYILHAVVWGSGALGIGDSSRPVTRQSQPEWFGCGGRDDLHDEAVVSGQDPSHRHLPGAAGRWSVVLVANASPLARATRLLGTLPMTLPRRCAASLSAADSRESVRLTRGTCPTSGAP